MFHLVQELVELVREFQADGIDYAVCGGLAMAMHGYTRATEDIDILVEADSLPRIRKLAERCGFRMLGSTPDFQFKNGGRLVRMAKLKKDDEDFLVLDLMLASGPNAPAWASRQDVRTKWGPVRVVSQPALKEMKRAAGRPKDLFDINLMENPDEAS